MTEPIRQCIVCRKRRFKKELFRIVRTPEDVIEFDVEQKKNGRGLYICKDDSCLEIVKSRDLVSRIFNIRVPISLYMQVDEYYTIAVKPEK